MKLSISDHDRGAAGLRYVYPVLSRRARGVSIGVNLNPNNACNWRCVYCQVPNLVAGAGPEIDLGLLEAELRSLLDDVVHGDFMQRRVPPEARRLEDVAFSGNGEPTSSPRLVESIQIVGRVLAEFGLQGTARVRLITNGSLIRRRVVENGLRKLAELGGEVWFKLDRATAGGMQRVHSRRLDPARHLARLRRCAELCPTWIQTIVYAWDEVPPPEPELRAYLDALRALVEDAVPVRGVLLYGPARSSGQPEAARISELPGSWMRAFARSIEATGLPVHLADGDFLAPSEQPGAIKRASGSSSQ
jgi:wyosine [tRNA(Phe)-imidazoG37] synthetase (radical SAM superfamily)